MNLWNKKFNYILAITLGLISPFIPETGPYHISLLLFFLTSGSILGFLSPKESWRWGIWICGPILILTLLSVLFAGNIHIFLKKDLPLLLISFLVASLGAAILSSIKNKQIISANK